MYAISNALELCGVRDHLKAWDVACEAIAKERWPQVLWQGTYFDERKAMIDEVRHRVRGANRFHYCFPFSDDRRRSDGEFRKLLRHCLEATDTRCAIVKLNHPYRHWLVAKADGGRIQFVDSLVTDSRGNPKRKNLASIGTGTRRSRMSDDQWVIDRREIVLIQKEQPRRSISLNPGQYLP